MQVLEQLQHDHKLPSIILDHRGKHKWLTGFVETICERARRLGAKTGESCCFQHDHALLYDMASARQFAALYSA